MLAIEDLHWVDKTSEDFFDFFSSCLVNTRILLIFLYRPEYTHRWASKSFYTNINVGQLSTKISSDLVQSILREGEIGPELKDLILGKTSGNPLFIEELTHTLLENGSIQKQQDHYVLSRKGQDLQVPDTIQGIIAARIDRLEEGLKKIMQVASVIGREFAFRILQSITEMKEELKGHLLNLQGLEFIYERRLFPELEYFFKHALTQEVAYNSLLLSRRKEIHGKIGAAIEQIYPDRLSEFYEILAYHYAKSDRLQKAIKYFHLAGKKALKLYAIDEAADNFLNCLSLVDKLPAEEAEPGLKLDLGTKLGFSYLLRNRFAKAYEVVQPLELLADEKKYPRSSGRILVIAGVNQLFNLKLVEAIRHLERALEISTTVGDIPALGFASTYLAYGNVYNGNFERVQSIYHSIISILEERQDWYTLVVPYFGLAFIFSTLGDLKNAEKWSRRTFRCLEKVDDPFTQSWGNLAMGHFHLERGNFEEAEICLMRAWDKARSITFSIALEHALIDLGWLHLRRGDYEKGLMIRRSVERFH